MHRPLLPVALAWLIGLWVFLPVPERVPVVGRGPREGVVLRPVQVDGQAGFRRALVELDDPPARVLITDAHGRGAVPLPGDRVRFVGEVRAPRGYRNPGASDRARTLAARGAVAVASARPPGLVVVGREPSGWRLAAEGQRRLAAPFAGEGDGPALLRALVAGDRRALAPSLEDAFRRTGTAHVLSVSGLHLAAVAGLAFLVARRAVRALLRRRPALTRWFADADRAAAWVAAPIAVAYTLVTGAEIATLRALVCVLVHLTARLVGRRPDALTTLAAAALLLTLVDPAAAHDPSFQLSFAATATLVVAAGRLAGRRWLLRVAGVSAAVWCVTAPIGALHFGTLQPMGLVANPLVVPILELVLLPAGLLAALVGQLWTLPAEGLAFVAGLVAAGVRQLGTIAPSWDVPPPTLFEGLGFAGAALAFACRRRLLGAALLLGVALRVAWSLLVAPLLETEVRVTFLDVGQGDAALVEVPGERWLIDSGGRLFGAPGPEATLDERLAAKRIDPGEQAIWPTLRTRRIFHLDVVVISHPHPDHYGGLPALLEHVSVGEVWIAGDEVEDPRWRALLAELTRRGVVVRRPPLGEARRVGGARLVVLAPRGPGELVAADPGLEVNDNSLVARVDFAGRRVLFTGDLEEMGEALLDDDLRADVVKVPHHGSRTSSSAALVAATRPSLAVVSCGVDNQFGFPAAEVVARWRAGGAVVRTTAEEGAISVVIGPDGTLR